MNKYFVFVIFTSVTILNGCGSATLNDVSSSLSSSISKNLANAITGSVSKESAARNSANMQSQQGSTSSSKNEQLEAAGYTRPSNYKTSQTISECIDRMPYNLTGRIQACGNKIELQKKGYLSPYEAGALKRMQKMERDNQLKIKKKS